MFALIRYALTLNPMAKPQAGSRNRVAKAEKLPAIGNMQLISPSEYIVQ